MQRREARLRREYLYRKSIEQAARAKYERKRILKEAMEKGIPLTREQRMESERLAKELAFDPNIQLPSTHMDDEYANGTMVDPRVVITTSRKPSSQLRIFAKEMKLVIPNSQRVNRGSTVVGDLVNACKQHDISDLIILHEHRGRPSGMHICHLPYGPTAYFSLHNVKLRKDIKNVDKQMAQVYPHIVMDKFQTELGQRVSTILKHLFPVPKAESKRIVTFANNADYVSFRHHVYSRDPETGKLKLNEQGPRFELELFKIVLGTLEMKDVEIEWAYRPYMNTAKKRLYL